MSNFDSSNSDHPDYDLPGYKEFLIKLLADVPSDTLQQVREEMVHPEIQDTLWAISSAHPDWKAPQIMEIAMQTGRFVARTESFDSFAGMDDMHQWMREQIKERPYFFYYLMSFGAGIYMQLKQFNKPNWTVAEDPQIFVWKFIQNYMDLFIAIQPPQHGVKE